MNHTVVGRGSFSRASFPSIKPKSRFKRVCTCHNDSNSDDEPPQLKGDWRQFRKQLVSDQLSYSPDQTKAGEMTPQNRDLLESQDPPLASEDFWAHEIGEPEAGCLLLAAPHISSEFWQSVILVIEISKSGSIGFVLNRPTGYLFSQGYGGVPVPIDSSINGSMKLAFQNNVIYWGGSSAPGVVHCLHKHPLDGAVQIGESGIFIGGEEAASQAVLDGRIPASDFKFFAGAVVWKDGELKAEMREERWMAAASCRAIALKQCLQLPVPLWIEVLMLCGGGYSEVAKRTREEDRWM
jgi:putative AlgH/UPF0301 family transcriptional regulator